MSNSLSLLGRTSIILLLLVIVMAIPAQATAASTSKGTTTTSYNYNKKNDASINFEARYILTPVKDVDMWIVVTLVNSPYNGQAEIKQVYQYSYDYGFIVSKTVTVSTEWSLAARNGEAVAAIQYWRVRFYDVWECIAGCAPRGYIGEPQYRIPNTGEYLIAYQRPGDLVDDTTLEVYTVDSQGNIIGVHTVDPTFNEADDYIGIAAYTACHKIAITYHNETTTSISMSIGANINGRLSISVGNLHLSFTKSSENSVTYTFCAKPGYIIIYYIDYKGDYSRDRKPLIWSFYVIIYKQYTTSKNLTYEDIIKSLNNIKLDKKVKVVKRLAEQ
jgi:hypothetical protein